MSKTLIVSALILFVCISCKKSTKSDLEPLVISMVPTHVSIFGASDGSVDLTVTGGDSPFQYQWSNGETTEDISNLTAGIYLVTVTDSDIQTIIDSVKINQPTSPLQGRDYNFYIPSSYTGDNAVPLVIALHPRGSNGNNFEFLTGFSQLAQNEKFIVVYPNATGEPSQWNEGLGHTPSTLDINDVEFISTLIDEFIINYNIDTNRVYITGFSTGSLMAHLLAVKLSTKITAIGAVAVHPTNPILNMFPPEKLISILHFYMLDDQSVSYNGGTLNNVSYPPVEDAIAAWVDANNCLTQPTIIMDDGEVYARQWTSNDSNIDVVLYRINTGGHNWLSSPISMTEIIWEYFENHSR